jgi:hypothetical protein
MMMVMITYNLIEVIGIIINILKKGVKYGTK